jgi:hypothetical protein
MSIPQRSDTIHLRHIPKTGKWTMIKHIQKKYSTNRNYLYRSIRIIPPIVWFQSLNESPKRMFSEISIKKVLLLFKVIPQSLSCRLFIPLRVASLLRRCLQDIFFI